MRQFISAILFALVVTGTILSQENEKKMESPIYNFSMKMIDGTNKSLADFRGHVVMVVNTASFCGFTPQYKDLESIYKKYKEKGFVVIGFPANNFGKQEPGKDNDIAEFCERNYGVTFPIFSKISVKGDDIHPLYKYLTTETPYKEDIGWNFTKFLIDKTGKVVARFASKIKPTDKTIVSKIDELLVQK